jgi:bifunctional non-homologous end joining protein LigD
LNSGEFVSLVHYQSKRDLTRSGEPRGTRSRSRRKGSPRFVVQKHAARRLHYDFRLELGGVLKSWALPKGFPTVQGEKHLAMEVEDHPLAYGNFEGIIPPGNYGTGTVMLWDKGDYDVLEPDAPAALRRGKLTVNLQGDKLKGHWTLVRMRNASSARENAWLIIKSEEDVPAWSARKDDTSVKSGRSMKQIGAAADRKWKSDRVSDFSGDFRERVRRLVGSSRKHPSRS